jgi:hypothetical protein
MTRARGDGDEPSNVSARRQQFLRRPSAWPSGFAGFEQRWEGPNQQEITEELARSLEAELRQELAPGHRLYGRDAVAIAKREANDDVLFALPNSAEVAVVHLTWARRPEPLPWPRATIYASFDEFLGAASDDA